ENICVSQHKICSTNFFFFSSRRRHTSSDRDWSSDVCSSDLIDQSVMLVELKRLYSYPAGPAPAAHGAGPAAGVRASAALDLAGRSEERRVGKECRYQWGQEHRNNTNKNNV